MLNKSNKASAYVDGSFNSDIGKYAYGCVLFHDDGYVEELCGSGNAPEGVAQRNVAGEMIAAMLSVKWALLNGYESIEIFYDYSGIEKWVTGEWRAKNELTQKYRNAMQNWGKRIRITFSKVAAHTNVRYNERADRLAKEGLTKEAGLPQIVPYRKNR